MSEPSFKISDLFSIEGNSSLGRIGTPADLVSWEINGESSPPAEPVA